ncbi:hypothetical protein CFAM422_012667 [Trichoderma lentiforme]|uniref:Transposase n=1 Tax=Trichoderma lentiforme TaxID=1567552 RepID=A0A9P4X3N9_9HYPO|nr:hypothetical protein CFAM422_012667 [Trichoderma lentiforme]
MTSIYEDADYRQQPPTRTPTPDTPWSQLEPSPSPVTPSVWGPSPSPSPVTVVAVVNPSPRSRILGPGQIRILGSSHSPRHDRNRGRGRSRSPCEGRGEGCYRSRSPRRPLQPITPNRAVELTRDDRVAIRALRDNTDFSILKIARLLDVTYRQVQWALSGPLTPRKQRPRKGKLSDEQLQQLKLFLDEDVMNRTIAWQDLRFFVPGFEFVGVRAITTGLRQLGYSRVKRKRKCLSNPQVRAARVRMCRQLLARRPRPSDWLNFPIAFSDETWAKNSMTGVKWLTVHETEDENTFNLLRHRGNGWMF